MKWIERGVLKWGMFNNQVFLGVISGKFHCGWINTCNIRCFIGIVGLISARFGGKIGGTPLGNCPNRKKNEFFVFFLLAISFLAYILWPLPLG